MPIGVIVNALSVVVGSVFGTGVGKKLSDLIMLRFCNGYQQYMPDEKHASGYLLDHSGNIYWSGSAFR